jgi:hypothetical protein
MKVETERGKRGINGTNRSLYHFRLSAFSAFYIFSPDESCQGNPSLVIRILRFILKHIAAG